MRPCPPLLSAWKVPAVFLLAAALFLQSFPLTPFAIHPGGGATAERTSDLSALDICDGESGSGAASQTERLCSQPPSAPAPSAAAFFLLAVSTPLALVPSSRLFRPPRA